MSLWTGTPTLFLMPHLLAQVTVSVQVTTTTAPAGPGSPGLTGSLPRTGLAGGSALLLVAVMLLCLGAAMRRTGGRATTMKGN